MSRKRRWTGEDLCVHDEYECSHFPEDRVKSKRRIKKVDLAGKIPDLKVDK
jgi:hypothetical protein